jgi:hypothetical protein
MKPTKKLVSVFVLLLSIVFALAACGSQDANPVSQLANPVGAYGIKSMTQGDTTFTADELSANGVDVAEFRLDMLSDGTFTMAVLTGAGKEEVKGTWEFEGGTIFMTADGMTIEATFDGKLLVANQDGTELVFEMQSEG